MINEIIEELEHLLNNFGEHCEEYEDGNCTHKSCSDCVLNHAIDIVKKHANDGWISVDDGLPKEYKVEVLTRHERDYMMSDNVHTTYIDKYGETKTSEDFTINGKWLNGDVIAWRPLPDKYKPNKENN